MTEILRAFWKEKRPERIAVLVSGILFAVIFWIYKIPVEIAGYAFLLVILWNVIWFTLVFIRYEKRQRILEENQGKIRTEAGGFPEAESRESEMYQELIRQLYEEKKELESSVQIEKQELSDYYSMWVHQIKTPIAALGVLIQSGEELEEVQESPKAQELTRSMKMEVFRIEQYVDMVLTYLRMGSATSDYTFRICSLEEIVRQAVRKYSQMFIMTRTRLHLEIQDQKILTDEKWLTFVIEQILSNAVKYARGGEISIYTEEKTLVISDNGIGIAEEDLPRIFEKGFTGYNGRANKKSTGIGLYLCKTIIDRLHHTIWIESKPEKGTKVYLNFDREHRRLFHSNESFPTRSLQKCKKPHTNCHLLRWKEIPYFFIMTLSNKKEGQVIKTMALLDVKNVKKIYTTRFGGNQVEALHNVSFSVEAGEYVAIMGESGSGKTTLLNILAALDKPTGGKVYLKGNDLSKIREKEMAAFRRQNLGFVFQDFNLLDTLTLKDNIFLPLVLSGKKYTEMESRIAPIAEQLGISKLLNKYPYEVSGGQKQRAAIVRALITQPQLILADEPSGALDSRSTDELLGLFNAINDNGQTIVMVTHSVKAASTAKRVLFIKDGEVFHQLYRGNLTSDEMYQKITDTLTVLTTGGEHRE